MFFEIRVHSGPGKRRWYKGLRSSAVIPIAPKDSNKNCICNSVSLAPRDLNFELRRNLVFAAPVSEICAAFTATRRLPFAVLSAAFFIDFSADAMGR